MTDAGRRPNRRGEGNRLRGEILAAAAAILAETGDEHAVTLRAVARRAGIAAPSIYAHFADRQLILLAVVQDAFADLAEGLRAAAGPDPGPLATDPPATDPPATDPPATDPPAQLRATCDAYLAYAAQHPQRYRVMFGGVWDGGGAAAGSTVTVADVTGLGREALELLTARLRACVDADRSTSTDVEADAVALWLGLHGLAHQRTVVPGFPWPPDIADRVVASLARLRWTGEALRPGAPPPGR